MTIRKTLTAFIFAGVMLTQSVRADAATFSGQMQPTTSEPQTSVYQFNAGNNRPNAVNGNINAVMPMAQGLIVDYSDSLRAGTGCVYLTSKTISNSTMRRIGMKEIALQYSSTGASYSDIAYLGDIQSSGSSMCAVYGKRINTLNGAGYYRVRLTHFAYSNPANPQSITIYTNAVKLYY